MKLISILLLVLLCSRAQGQTATIVVLGSSTAEGQGATPYSPLPDHDSGWVNRLRLYYNQNSSDGLDTVVINLAKGGYNTYQIMPSDYPTPANKPLPDTARNVTKALSFDPDVILINLPSNDIAVGFTKEEIMNNFRYLYNYINNSGVNVFITTTQPRYFDQNPLMMQYQRDLVDSIQNNFGYFSINFWDDLVAVNPPYTLKPEVSAGDGTHINNLGHQLVFLRVAAKNLFVSNTILPVHLKTFEAKKINNKVLLQWETMQEESPTLFHIERSSNGQDFFKIAMVQGKDLSGATYEFYDDNPERKLSFYRLRIETGSGHKFSAVQKVQFGEEKLSLSQVIIHPGHLGFLLNTATPELVRIRIYTAAGNIVENRQQMINLSAQVKLPVSHLPSGVYFLVVNTGREQLTHAFYRGR